MLNGIHLSVEGAHTLSPVTLAANLLPHDFPEECPCPIERDPKMRPSKNYPSGNRQESPIFVDDIPRQTGGVRSRRPGRGGAGTASDGSLRRGARMVEGRGAAAAVAAATAPAPAPRIEPPGGDRRRRRRRRRRHGTRYRLAVGSGARAPLATPAHAPDPPPVPPFPRGPTDVVVYVVLLQMQVYLLDDELPLLVLLAILVGLRVRPSNEGATALAGYVRDGV